MFRLNFRFRNVRDWPERRWCAGWCWSEWLWYWQCWECGQKMDQPSPPHLRFQDLFRCQVLLTQGGLLKVGIFFSGWFMDWFHNLYLCHEIDLLRLNWTLGQSCLMWEWCSHQHRCHPPTSESWRSVVTAWRCAVAGDVAVGVGWWWDGSAASLASPSRPQLWSSEPSLLPHSEQIVTEAGWSEQWPRARGGWFAEAGEQHHLWRGQWLHQEEEPTTRCCLRYWWRHIAVVVAAVVEGSYIPHLQCCNSSFGFN